MNQPKTTMNLGHLAMSNVSAGGEWLKSQSAQREKAKAVVVDLAKQYFPQSLPDVLFDAFAERIVTALDHQV